MDFRCLLSSIAGACFASLIDPYRWFHAKYEAVNDSRATTHKNLHDSYGLNEDRNWEKRNHTRPHTKLIIFVRHGQYNLKGATANEKVLTVLGWRQAYEVGCHLRRSGIRIDRIIHSDLIRARQTTAAILVGLQEDGCERLLDSPILSDLSSPSSENTPMLGPPYSPYPWASFDCQQSRFLTEGPPPVSPEPPLRKVVEESVRLSQGRRIEAGFTAHVHPIPVTLSGLRGCFTKNNASSAMDPCETIVFVGHANVFRFWLCRALRLPDEAWLRISLHHGSITSILLHYDAQLSSDRQSTTTLPSRCTIATVRLGEIGHLPINLLTR